MDPLSVASGVAGLASLAIEATKATCKYVSEVSHAGETVLQCLQALSLLRDVLETLNDNYSTASLSGLSGQRLGLVFEQAITNCKQKLMEVTLRLQALFNTDGSLKKRHAISWPFRKTETTDLIRQLQDFRDTFAAALAADTLAVSVATHNVATETHGDIQDIKQAIENERRSKERSDFLDWISPKSTASWRSGNAKEFCADTCDWFFISHEFKDWISSSSGGVLWCHGQPGSGKSVLMSRAVEQLHDPRGAQQTRVISHFCDHQDPRTQSLDIIVRHLIQQTALQCENILHSLMTCQEYKEARTKGRNLRGEEGEGILLDICLSDKRTILVVDGLDECPEELDGSDARRNILRLLRSVSSKGTRVLIASRSLPDIYDQLSGCRELEIRARDSDLRVYIAKRLQGLEKRVPKAGSLKDEVTKKIVEDADGVFLLARLMLDMISPAKIKNLRQIKTFLGERSWDMTKMYQETLNRILSQDDSGAELARRTLLWLCYSQRPLHIDELQHALATEIDDEDFDPDGITPCELISSSCMGLVIWDDQKTCHLFHLTAYDFFHNTSEFSSTIGHLLISKTCLSYLSFSSIRDEGLCPDLRSLEGRMQNLCLVDYAAKYWGEHSRQVEDMLGNLIVPFITDETRRDCLTQVFYHRKREDPELQGLMFETLPTGRSPLQIICGFGLASVARWLIEDGADATQGDNQGWTPLIAAASYGRLNTIDLLIQLRGDDSDTTSNHEAHTGIHKPDNQGWTPLFWAVIKGQFKAAEHLLAAGASTSFKDKNAWTPIDWAAFRGDRSLVKLLLRYTSLHPLHRPQTSRRPRRTSQGNDIMEEFSPIYLAAAAGDHETVEILLQHGTQAQKGVKDAAVNLWRMLSKSERFYGYNKRLAYVSHPSIVITESFTVSLLDSAIKSNQLPVVKILMELGAQLYPVEGELKGRSPLHIAACCGNLAICEYLISKGADQTLKDNDGHTPLDLAIIAAASTCVHLLLSTPIESTLTIEENAVALLFHGWYGIQTKRRTKPDFILDPHMQRVSYHMLDNAASNFNAACHVMQSSEESARQPSEQPSETLIETTRLLLNRGCDINGRAEGKTALHYACSQSSVELVKFLVLSDADVDAPGVWGSTPLYEACQNSDSCEELIDVLVQHGANINAPNESECTPFLEACQYLLKNAVKYLIAHGADVNVYDNLGRHPLHMACARSVCHPHTKEGTVELIDYLITLSEPETISAECQYYEGGNYLDTPLSLAVNAGNWDAVKFLRQHGAIIRDKGSISSALWENASTAQGEIFKLLLEIGADPTAPTYKFPIIAHSLLEFGDSSSHAIDVFKGNLKALMQAGADINARDDTVHATALHRAVQYHLSLEFVQVLLQTEADPTLKDYKGETPYDWAKEAGNEEISALLHTYMPEAERENCGVRTSAEFGHS